MTRDECAESLLQLHDLPIIVRQTILQIVRNPDVGPEWLLILADAFDNGAQTTEQIVLDNLKLGTIRKERGWWAMRETKAAIFAAARIRSLAGSP